MGLKAQPWQHRRGPMHEERWSARLCNEDGLWECERLRVPLMERSAGMTWVVGNATIDLGVLIGDIRLSWMTQDGRMKDEIRFGVQKLHMVNPSLWAGFAGSVDIGFGMVERLRSASTALTADGERPEPETIVERWRDDVVQSYDNDYPDDCRRAGCHMLVLGASQRWVELNGRRLFRTTRLFLLELPLPGHAFAGFAELQWNHFYSIGSGSRVEEYCRLLDETTADGRQGLLAFRGLGDYAPLAGFLTSIGMGTVIEKTPTPGISSNLLTAVVTADGTHFGSNEGADVVLPNVDRRVAVPPMPPLAHDRAEFDSLAKRFAPGIAGVAIA